MVLTLGDPLKHWDVVRAAAASPDGKWLASGSDDGTVKLRDAAAGKEVRAFAALSRGQRRQDGPPVGRGQR